MKEIWNRIVRFWRSLETLDERIYYMTLVVTGVAALVCTVAGTM